MNIQFSATMAFLLDVSSDNDLPSLVDDYHLARCDNPQALITFYAVPHVQQPSPRLTHSALIATHPNYVYVFSAVRALAPASYSASLISIDWLTWCLRGPFCQFCWSA